MALAETAQALTDARVNSLTDAFNRGDVDKIMSWHSKDTKFEDPGEFLTTEDAKVES